MKLFSMKLADLVNKKNLDIMGKLFLFVQDIQEPLLVQ